MFESVITLNVQQLHLYCNGVYSTFCTAFLSKLSEFSKIREQEACQGFLSSR